MSPPTTLGVMSSDNSWIGRYPMLGATLLLSGLLIFVMHFYMSSRFESPVFMLVLCFIGFPLVVQYVFGLSSIFSPSFFALRIKQKLITFALAVILFSPSFFVLWLLQTLSKDPFFRLEFFPKFGIEYLFVGFVMAVSWLSGFIARDMSRDFAKMNLWPSVLEPNFGFFGSGINTRQNAQLINGA